MSTRAVPAEPNHAVAVVPRRGLAGRLVEDRLRRLRADRPAGSTGPAGRGPVGDPEAGLVAVWFAMLISVFVGVAALGVDVSTWHLRAQELQRAADAASLDAVVFMPDALKARDAAMDSLRKNGVDPSRVTFVGTEGRHDRQYRVSLTDPDVPTFFGRIFTDRITIGRSALAEYTAPVPMGSPRNYLGWGGAALTLAPGVEAAAATPNYWLGLNGYCLPKEHGDLLSARYDGNGNPLHCGTGEPQGSYYEDQATVALPGQLPSYRPDGYLYSVVAPAGTTTVSIYDPAHCPEAAGGIDRVFVATPTMVPLTYLLRAPDIAGTPNDFDDDPIVASGTYSTCTAALSWVDIATLTQAGTYILQIRTPPHDHSLAINLFGLRATTNGDTRLCDSRINGNCPKVSGLTAMSIMTVVNSATARFNFAEVARAYAGKQIVIGLWDPGEGMTAMRIIDPNGNVVPFRLRVTPSFSGSTPAFTSGSQTTLDVSGCGPEYPQPGPNRAGRCLYNDRLVELLVDVPTSYTGGWWSVEYVAGTTPTDRTTWTVRIVGDPTHLTRD